VLGFFGAMHRLALRFSSWGEVCGFVRFGVARQVEIYSIAEQRSFPRRTLSFGLQPAFSASHHSGSYQPGFNPSGSRPSGFHLLLLADFRSAQRVFRVRCCSFYTGYFENARA
jgi:hypothetical protein